MPQLIEVPWPMILIAIGIIGLLSFGLCLIGADEENRGGEVKKAEPGTNWSADGSDADLNP